MPTADVPAAVVLAAGRGRRFGRPKSLVAFDDELLVDRSVRIAREAGCDPVIVVVGADAQGVLGAAELDGAVVVVNHEFASGIASSLRCGLAAAAVQGAPAAVVLLVDQPLVGPALVQRLVHAWRDGARAVVASYNGRPRNPVLLGADTWAGVSTSAHDDVGARPWLRAHADEVRLVACEDLGSELDIDTTADLAALTARLEDTA